MSVAAEAGVVVGVDGSECSLAAVRSAAAEAVRRGRPLRIVHAFIWPLLRVPVEPSAFGPPEGGLRNQAERILAEAAEHARLAAPGLAVSTSLVDGAAAPVLLAESRHAALLVVGDRGLGGFASLVIGSVAVQAAAHAACPVLVVRGEEHGGERAAERDGDGGGRAVSGGPVVVGVDGSETSALAVGFAVEEAALRGAELVAVHAWSGPVSAGPGDMLPLVFDAARLEEEEREVLAESLVAWRERYPEVVIRPELVHGRATQHLIERSATAQLVVVGARGRGGFTGLLLGSVSQTIEGAGRDGVVPGPVGVEDRVGVQPEFLIGGAELACGSGEGGQASHPAILRRAEAT